MDNSFELDEIIRDAVSRYSGSLIRIAFAYVRNVADAEDIAQEVFLAYLKKRPAFGGEEHRKAWLIRVAINKSKNHLKAVWFRNRNPIPDDIGYLPQEEGEVLGAVLKLAPKYRLPIHLHYYEGYSIGEIARMLRIKPATVGTQLARGRVLLKKMIGGLDDG